ncbi:MAG: RHS repeat-associated core domain-containing protein, partial [Luteibacter sp.]
MVRQNEYFRASSGQPAELRTQRLSLDAATRIHFSFDARIALAARSVLLNVAGSVVREDSVDAGWRCQLVDTTGHVRRWWDARGVTSVIRYDQRGRLVSCDEGYDGRLHRAERLRYGNTDASEANACGRVVQHADPAGITVIGGYSLGGAVVTEGRRFLEEMVESDWADDLEPCGEPIEAEEYVTAFRYSAAGEVIATTDPDGHVCRRSYSIAGQEDSMYLQDGPLLVTGREYDAAGRIDRECYANGLVTVSSVDPASGRPALRSVIGRSATAVHVLTYGYDPAGNVVRVERGEGAVASLATYGLDTLYQLVHASGWQSPGAKPFDAFAGPRGKASDRYTQRYLYDAGGNLVETRHEASVTQVQSLVVSPTSNRAWPMGESADFDAAGNPIRQRDIQRIEWNARGGISHAWMDPLAGHVASVESYAYDAKGRRMRRRTLDGAGGLLSDIRHLHEFRRIRSVSGTASGGLELRAAYASICVGHQGSAAAVRYDHFDAVGSAVVVFDDDGALIRSEHYFPYGATASWNSRDEGEEPGCSIHFAGRERDGTGLRNFGHRVYDPGQGRWPSPDPDRYVDGTN